MSTPYQLHTLVSMPYNENTYIVWRENSKECLVVDPGFEPEQILDFLQTQELDVVAILNTHGHVDHIAGNDAVKQAYSRAPLIIGVNEKDMLTDPMLNLSAFSGSPIVSPPADQTVEEGEVLSVAGFSFEVLEIPGHSPGHVVFVCKEFAPTFVLGGDVLFRGSIGRTDFPGGSMQQLLDGIRTKLFALPPETLVYSGHGPTTTVGHEQKTNPFLT